jgi:hypothetical protein
MQITASCSGLAFYGDAGLSERHEFTGGCMPLQLRRGRAMRVSAGPQTQIEILCRSNRFVPFEASRQCGDEIMSIGEGRVYRGNWAEQRVVARLATNKTRKATRITTTPPTVSRSQRSELSRASNSRFPVITLVLISNFTALTNDCSDQDHRPTLCPSPTQRRIASTKIFPFVFQERRFA